MRLVNENLSTEQLAVHVAFGDDGPALSSRQDDDAERVTVEFGEDGVADDVPSPLGDLLVDTYPSIREAEGPDDVAAAYEATDLEDLTVADLEDRADKLGLDAEDIEGTGADGNVVKADWIRAIRDADADN